MIQHTHHNLFCREAAQTKIFSQRRFVFQAQPEIGRKAPNVAVDTNEIVQLMDKLKEKTQDINVDFNKDVEETIKNISKQMFSEATDQVAMTKILRVTFGNLAATYNMDITTLWTKLAKECKAINIKNGTDIFFYKDKDISNEANKITEFAGKITGDPISSQLKPDLANGINTASSLVAGDGKKPGDGPVIKVPPVPGATPAASPIPAEKPVEPAPKEPKEIELDSEKDKKEVLAKTKKQIIPLQEWNGESAEDTAEMLSSKLFPGNAADKTKIKNIMFEAFSEDLWKQIQEAKSVDMVNNVIIFHTDFDANKTNDTTFKKETRFKSINLENGIIGGGPGKKTAEKKDDKDKEKPKGEKPAAAKDEDGEPKKRVLKKLETAGTKEELKKQITLSQAEVIERLGGKDQLENGDKITIKRYEAKPEDADFKPGWKTYHAEYKDGKFHHTDIAGKPEVIFFPSDKITPVQKKEKNKESRPLPMDVDISGINYNIGGKTKGKFSSAEKKNYGKIAKDIIEGEGKLTNLRPEKLEDIKASGMSVEEFAKLLKEGNEQIDKDYKAKGYAPNEYIAIILPHEASTKKRKDTSEEEKKAAEKVTKEKAEKAQQETSAERTAILRQINAQDEQPKVAPQAKLALAAKNKETWDASWQDNIDKTDIKAVVGRYPTLSSINDGQLREKVFKVASNENFKPEDVAKAFDLKAPEGKSYEDALKETKNSPNGKFADYIVAIQALTNAIGKLNLKSTINLGSVEEKDRKAAEGLRDVITLLGPETYTPIQRVPKGDHLYSRVVYKGHQADIFIDPSPVGRWDFYVYSVEGHRQLLKISDQAINGLDPADDVGPIRNAIMSNDSLIVKGYKLAEDKASEKDEKAKAGSEFHSLTKLEMLGRDVPGMPLSEKIKVSKAENKLLKNAKDLFKRMHLYEEGKISPFARIADNAANLQKMEDNDQCDFNVRYKGRDLTMRIDNTAGGWEILLAPGFNQTHFVEKANISDSFGFDTDDNKKEIDNLLKGNLIPEVGYNIMAEAKEAGVALTTEFLNRLNAKLNEGTQRAPLDLDATQALELVFRLYNFEELDREGAIQKGEEGQFILKGINVTGEKSIRLPEKLENTQKDANAKEGYNQYNTIRRMAYAIKYRKSMTDDVADDLMDIQEKAKDLVSEDNKARRVLRKIFTPEAGAYTKSGKKLDVTDIEAGATTADATYKFYQQVNGKSALDAILRNPKIMKVDQNGKEFIDQRELNQELQKLYNAGEKNLATLGGRDTSDPYYQKLLADYRAQKPGKIGDTRLEDLSDLQIEIIRLGYIKNQQEKESKQFEYIRQKMADPAAANIVKLLQEKGYNISPEQKNVIAEMLPFQLWLNGEFNTNASSGEIQNGLLAGVPISIPIREGINVVIVPGAGFGNVKDGGFTPLLTLNVGISGERKMNDRITLLGSVGIGSYGNSNDIGGGVGATGEIDFVVHKGGENGRNWEDTVGVRATAGLGLSKLLEGGGGGFDIGVAYKFKRDAQKDLEDKIKKEYEMKGVQAYIERLNGGENMVTVANEIAKDPNLKAALNLPPDSTPENTMAVFSEYTAEIAYKVSENYNPLVMGGEVGLSVVKGSLLIIGAAGVPPLFIGTLAGMALEFMLSLKWNVKSELVLNRRLRTSDQNRDAYNELQRNEQIDEQLNKLMNGAMKDMRTPEVDRKIKAAELAGKIRLDKDGHLITDKSTGGLEKMVVALNVDAYNEKLMPNGIRLVMGEDKKIEIQFLESLNRGNNKILISPNIATMVGDKVYLKDPNALQSLYVHKQTDGYPFEIGHGATQSSVVLISDNRYFGKQNIDVAIEASRFEDEPKNTWHFGKTESGEAKAFEESSLDMTRFNKAQDRMRGGLHTPEKEDELRANPEEMTALAKKVYKFEMKNGQSGFLRITNQGGERPVKTADSKNYEKDEVFKLFERYARANGNSLPEKIKAAIKDDSKEIFTPKEKEQLLIDCSTERYVELEKRGDAFQKRCEWCRDNVLTPTFTNRIADIEKKLSTPDKPFKFKKTAKELAQQAIDDISDIDPKNDSPSKVSEFASAFVAIGNGNQGLNQLLHGAPTSDKKYGYIIGKDYSEALKDPNPDTNEDYELALLLREQLAPLPNIDTNNELGGQLDQIKELFNTPLARKIASIGTLVQVIGLENYEQVAEFYNTKKLPANPEGIKKFIEVVKKVRRAQNEDVESIGIEGTDGENHTFITRRGIQSGVFNKCGNYSAFVTEEVAIVPKQQQKGFDALATNADTVSTTEVGRTVNMKGLNTVVTAQVGLPTGKGGGEIPPRPPKAKSPVPDKKGEVSQTKGPTTDADTTHQQYE